MITRFSWKVLATGLCLMIVAAGMSGCKSKNKQLEIDPNEGMSSSGMENTQGDGQPNLDLENMLFDRYNGLKTIYFDYDSYSLRPDALSALSQNADMIKQAPGVIVQIAGHCDERGTQEYNLALGERRALAVREHLMKLGVSGDRMVTISYGEEFPAEMGSSESAWAKNRRAEFNRAQSL